MPTTGSTRVNREQRISLAVKTVLDDITHTSPKFSSVLYNGLLLKHSDGTVYIRQRPTFSYSGATAVPAAKGRGVYYWDSASNPFIVNSTKLYKDDYGTEITPDASASAFTDATVKVYFAELNGQLFISCPNVGTYGQGKYLLSSAASTFFDMEQPAATGGDDFTNWPPNNSKSLAHGLVVLDKTLYALDTEGTIWGSALNDGADWSDALNNVNAEREPDAGVYLAKHHNSLVVFGTRTIQFFYDAANSTGSPLLARNDITYNVGLAQVETVWEVGDIIFFMGTNGSGAVAFYKIEDFQLSPIDEPTITDYFAKADILSSKKFATGISLSGNLYYCITLDTYQTFVYDWKNQVWYVWQSDVDSDSAFPFISTTASTRTTTSGYADYRIYAITANGNFGVFSGFPGATDYFYNSSSATVHMQIITDQIDNGNRDWKMYSQLRYVGKATDVTQSLYVDWSDNNNEDFAVSYTSNRTIDISDPTSKLTRLGRAKSRSWKVDYAGSSILYIEGLDIALDIGTH